MATILVIDDDLDILQLVKLVLEGKGMLAFISAEPYMLEQLVDNLNPDVILMDISMPPFDGRDLCLLLKSRLPDLPVLLYSAGKVSASSIENCKADSFLAKPFDIDDLVIRLRSMV